MSKEKYKTKLSPEQSKITAKIGDVIRVGDITMELVDERIAALVGKYEAREASIHGKAVALGQKLRDLESRLAEVERRKQLRYAGQWDEHRECAENEFYSFQGEIWFAKCATRAKPGTDKDAWTLAVKRGRDAKG